MKVRIQERIGRIEIYEADTEEREIGKEAQRIHSRKCKRSKCLNEIPVSDARAVIPTCAAGIPAAVFDDQVDGAKAGFAGVLGCPGGGVEEAGADAACEG